MSLREKLNAMQRRNYRERGETRSSQMFSSAAKVIAMQVPPVANLVRARDDLLRQVAELTREREQLTQERDQLTQERDQLTRERDQLTRERDQLKHQVSQLAVQASEREAAMADMKLRLAATERYEFATQTPDPARHSGQSSPTGGARALGERSRAEIILEGITKEQLGIEVAPWFRPLVPKRSGYRSLSLDVFDADALRENARTDPNIAENYRDNIERVDLVGSATEIEQLVAARGLLGQIDYVVSSHNFEHLPDPIRFIRGCEAVLKPGGCLTMAIPDRRESFDYFRPHSTTAEFLAAYFERRSRPTVYHWFLQNSLHCRLAEGAQLKLAYSIIDDPINVRPLETLEEAYQGWVSRNENDDGAYLDVHCWVFTPSAFHLIVNDLRWLGVFSMQCVSIVGPNEGEFYAKLVKPEVTDTISRSDFYAERARLLHLVNDEATANSRRMVSLRRKLGQAKCELEERRQAHASSGPGTNGLRSDAERKVT